MTESISLKVYGMTCTLCSLTIESTLEKVEGVSGVTVNFATEKANLEYDNEKIKLDDLKKKIESLGFYTDESKLKNVKKALTISEIQRNKLRNTLIVAIILTFPLILAMVLGGLGFCHDTYDPNTETQWGNFIQYLRYKASGLHDWRLQMALATPVQFIIGFKFYKSSFYALKAKSATMDLLVVIGTTAAYFYSVYVSLVEPYSYIFGMKNIYFEASATIITLVLLGKYLESIARGKTSRAIQSLMQLRPKTAKVLRDGVEKDIPIDEVLVGDIVIVKPGERIPVDGVIIEGFSTIDESMITGESIPIEKKEKDFVTGASLNKFGAFKFKATKVENDTMFASIIKMIERAQEGKAPIQKIADKVSGVFIPIVLLVAAATFIIWFFFIYNHQIFIIDKPIIYAVSVLVVSCPCALGLATPAAIMVGMGKGAQNGILIKNGEELERACKINAMILDKTGTITTGKHKVTDIIIFDEEKSLYDEDSLLILSAIAEKNSEHPLGAAIYELGKEKFGSDIGDPDKFEAIPGNGVHAVIEDKTVLIGTKKFLEQNSIDVTKSIETLNSLQENSKTVILVAVNSSLVGVIALSDTIKKNSKEVISALENMGIEVYMLTGDNEKTALSVAKAVGIKNVIAEVQPENKAQEISKLKKEGKIVAMVGDGINDAPALATADVGFAMSTGTDVAIETADIVILRDDLTSLVSAIKLSQKTLRKIKQNLFWAFIYNLIGIPIAVLGYLNPVVGAVTMSLSSISVLLNSLSLKKFKV
ncbi:cation-translocating P-type ATPase [Clostridium sp. DJ247]|uniref:heavy metal translocating P-type ATPase n=1 Tax=Clostridium sp. DJ247 TaxID=2726188 RepID=UPI0016234237|nr:heavy metal translocating P-type ATPase [Clostridium sp. DJ247]MBC2580711.1 copper-translocating P-type ATPase [Clostridium sp. DJ247]